MTMGTSVAQRPDHAAREAKANDHPIRYEAGQQTREDRDPVANHAHERSSSTNFSNISSAISTGVCFSLDIVISATSS